MIFRTQTDNLIDVAIISPDVELRNRWSRGLAADNRFAAKPLDSTAKDLSAVMAEANGASVLIVDADTDVTAGFAELETALRTNRSKAPIIIVSRPLAEADMRQIVRMKVADWLPRAADAGDLATACERALKARRQEDQDRAAIVYSFFPALGGVGNTTMALAAATILAGKGKTARSVCLADLNFDSGTIADYLDIEPSLQLDDIADAPERVDTHLLDLMLARHTSGLTVLAAPNALRGVNAVSPRLVTKLLDVISTRFDDLVIDMPRHWLQWSESVLKASDRIFIVTDLSVLGLRRARRIADEFSARFGVPSKGTVIVNKTSWLTRHGVKKRDAYEALGDRLAGFVADAENFVSEAHNKGVPLSELKRSNRIDKDLAAILGPTGAKPGKSSS